MGCPLRASRWLLGPLLAASLRSAAAGAGEACAKPSCSGPATLGEFLVAVTDAGVYDRSMRPPCSANLGKDPTVVEVQFRLTQISAINQKNSHITMNGYLRTWWKDERLAFNGTVDGGCFDVLSFGREAMASIWLPDIYIDNLVQQEADGGFMSMVKVYPDGSVMMSEQLLITVKASMNFGRLPFDRHVARIKVASYSRDISELRLVPRGGEVASAASGVGLSAPAITSVVWSFPSDETEDPSDGFETPGKVSVEDGWDYVTLSFEYARKERYFIMNVMIPSLMFLLVSYIAFFVDPTAAPARAALAVIPVLIMRTMSNSVYASFPQGSQRMWLDDFLYTSMILCVGAACQFAVVMWYLQKQKARQANHKGLIQSRKAVSDMWKQADLEDITLWEVLQRYNRVEVTSDDIKKLDEDDAAGKQEDGARELPAAPKPKVSKKARVLAEEGDLNKRLLKQSPHAKENGVEESELTVLRYAHTIFAQFDKDSSGSLGPDEVRRAFAFFDIYKSTGQMAAIMCMFLRDQGMWSPEEELEVKFKFSQFTFLLISIDSFELANAVSGSLAHRFVAWFQAMSPSTMIDTVSRVCFPILMLLQVVVFYAILPLYPSGV
mmetsp:Transcript_56622/g.164083  ORF Transcript_56622/g.164083 Transcript_56622/m.164083 type:complete len:609 (-) Transcript_56622:123-1949(-)